MKKNICLVLIFFTFISVAPSFGKKIIVNDNSQRVVISRTSGHEYFEEYSEDAILEQKKQFEEEQALLKEEKALLEQKQKEENAYKPEEYDNSHRELLGKDMRLELAGTSWGYPVGEETAVEDVEEQLAEPVQNEEENVAEAQNDDMLIIEREASDYFIKDTLDKSDYYTPSGVIVDPKYFMP